jgi:hypothetical protein
MKKILFFSILLFLGKFALAQQQNPIQEKPLIQKIEKDSNTNTTLKSSNMDEGTNNPENTGSTKRIINGRVFYIKETENLKIEFVPNN